jgi:hypothetical protein
VLTSSKDKTPPPNDGTGARKAGAAPSDGKMQYADALPDSFMELHTEHPSFEAMLEDAGVTLDEVLDGSAGPAWEEFVRRTTSFKSWASMWKTGAREAASSRGRR